MIVFILSAFIIFQTIHRFETEYSVSKLSENHNSVEIKFGSSWILYSIFVDPPSFIVSNLLIFIIIIRFHILWDYGWNKSLWVSYYWSMKYRAQTLWWIILFGKKLKHITQNISKKVRWPLNYSCLIKIFSELWNYFWSEKSKRSTKTSGSFENVHHWDATVTKLRWQIYAILLSSLEPLCICSFLKQIAQYLSKKSMYTIINAKKWCCNVKKNISCRLK